MMSIAIAFNNITNKSEEASIVKACLQGDSYAQKKLYDQFAPKMYGVCLRYAKNKMDAEDTLQEGFIKVFLNIHQYKNTGSLEGWVRRVIVNTALEFLRKKKISFEYDDTSQIVTLERTQNDAINKLNLEDLMNVIHELPDGYQTIFNLFAIDGFSHKEIAEMLSISVGTSKSQYARARNHVQKIIKEKYS